MIIDDTDHVREMLVEMLQIDGFDVKGEGSLGVDAEELARKHQPDVLIVDYSMPGMNGLDAARKVLANDPDQNIILYSAYIDPYVEAEAKEVGIAVCVAKSEGLETLERRISELCLQFGTE